jgi:hypothetical protein
MRGRADEGNPTLTLESARSPGGPRPSVGTERADSAPSSSRCRACWLVGFGPAGQAFAPANGSIGAVGTRSGGGFPCQACAAVVGSAFGRAPLAYPAAGSHLDQVLSGTQAQGRNERGQVATPGVATDSAVEQGLEAGCGFVVFTAETRCGWWSPHGERARAAVTRYGC